MANFVSRFVPNMSKLSTHLTSLTEQDNEWVWDPVHEKSFQDVKEASARSSTLEFSTQVTTLLCNVMPHRKGWEPSLSKMGCRWPLQADHCRQPKSTTARLRRNFWLLYLLCTNLTSMFMDDMSQSNRTTNHCRF